MWIKKINKKKCGLWFLHKINHKCYRKTLVWNWSWYCNDSFFYSKLNNGKSMILSHHEGGASRIGLVPDARFQGSVPQWFCSHTSNRSCSTAGPCRGRSRHRLGGNLAPAEASHQQPPAGSWWQEGLRSEGRGDEFTSSCRRQIATV